jgi:hypothetical protein
MKGRAEGQIEGVGFFTHRPPIHRKLRQPASKGNYPRRIFVIHEPPIFRPAAGALDGRRAAKTFHCET